MDQGTEWCRCLLNWCGMEMEWNQCFVKCCTVESNIEYLHNAKILSKPEAHQNKTHYHKGLSLLRNRGCSLVSEYTVALRRASQVKKSGLGMMMNRLTSILFVDFTVAGSEFQRIVAETDKYLDSKFVLNRWTKLKQTLVDLSCLALVQYNIMQLTFREASIGQRWPWVIGPNVFVFYFIHFFLGCSRFARGWRGQCWSHCFVAEIT